MTDDFATKKTTGLVTSLASPSYIGDDVAYFAFSVRPPTEGLRIAENLVFYVDPQTPGSQAIVTICCAAYGAKAEIEITSGPEIVGRKVKTVQVSKPPTQ